MRREHIFDRLDWTTILIYISMLFLGWLSIYAALYDEANAQELITLSNNPGKQLLWIASCLPIILIILNIDYKFFTTFSYVIYGVTIVSLLLVLVLGTEVAGSKSWFQIGGFRIQPSEFAKFATGLALAQYMSRINFKIDQPKHQITALLLITAPMLLINYQGDTGSAMVYASFLLVMYREGLSPIYFIIGIGLIVTFILSLLISKTIIFISVGVISLLIIGLSLKNKNRIIITVLSTIIIVFTVTSVDFVMTKVLKPHQRNRVISLFNPDLDPLGTSWNVTQSKIAIGSGGFLGKGYLEGTQTKFDFVPAQSTDFIFCTLAEEQGWVGSLLFCGLFVSLFIRLSQIAERQKSKFSRIYGYSVLSIMFFHFAVNIAMTIGLFPVIGIPLPFFSYGGSSLWSFTTLLFIFLKLDAHRQEIWHC